MADNILGKARRAYTGSISLIAVAIAVAAAQAIAQDNTNGPADADAALADIVVTAQKRSQNLQDVPVSVSAVDSSTLENANITSAADLARIVPSLSIFATTGSVQPFLRGIGNPGSLIGNESSVAVYVDGVYLTRVPPSLLQLNSIDRVEVLKGPQGTLFGRNASAGLMHIITREPSTNPVIEGSVGYGNFQTFRGNVYASAGLADGLAVDVAGVIIDQAEGWGKNIATGNDWGKENTKSVRSKLRWEVGPDTTLTLSGDYTRSKSDFLAHSQYIYGQRRGYELPPFGLVPQAGFYDIEADADPVVDTEAWGISSKIEHDFGFATATSITAYRKENTFGRFDSDFSKQPALLGELYGRISQFSQELQLASNKGSSFDWLAGAYYLHSKAGYLPSRFTGLFIDQAAAGLPAVSDTYGRTQVKSASIYGQTTIHLGQRTNFTGGLRYTEDRLSGEGRTDFYLAGTMPVPGATVTGQEKFTKVTYKASLDHKINDDVMIYASQSRGYKSGLYNTLPFLPTAAKPEVLDASEVGFKSELLEKRLRLNGAIFYYDFKNAQFQQFDGPTVTIINAPSARIYGAELEGQAAVTDGLVLRFSGGYLNSKYRDFPNAQTPVINTNNNPATGPVGGYQYGYQPFDASGNDMVRVPKWTFSLGANYNLETEHGTFNFDASWAFNDGFAWDADNELRQPSYSIVDAQMKYTFPGEGQRFAIRLWAKNLTKEKYYVAQIQSDGPRGSSAMPGAPRSYGFDWLLKL